MFHYWLNRKKKPKENLVIRDSVGNACFLITPDGLSLLLASAYEAGAEDGYSNVADKQSRDECARSLMLTVKPMDAEQ